MQRAAKAVGHARTQQGQRGSARWRPGDGLHTHLGTFRLDAPAQAPQATEQACAGTDLDQDRFLAQGYPWRELQCPDGQGWQVNGGAGLAAGRAG